MGMLEAPGAIPPRSPIGKRVYIAIDRDRQRAGKRLAEWFAGFYGRAQLAEEVSVWGSRDECVARSSRRWSQRARASCVLNPVFDEMEHLEQLRGGGRAGALSVTRSGADGPG